MRTPSPSLLLLVAVLGATPAAAHIELTAPKNRYVDQKLGPCGKGGLDARTQRVTTFDSGQEITVAWTETIDHPAWYRIAFDPDGTDAFQDPTGFDDRDGGGPEVLARGLADKTGQGNTYSVTVKLPDVTCTHCTLQLIQVMLDKGPVYGDNDIYYQCADLVLVGPDAGVVSDAGVTPATPDAGQSPDSGPPAGNDGTGDDRGDASSDGGCSQAMGGLALWTLLGLGVWAVRASRQR